jgi:hypothetical protein
VYEFVYDSAYDSMYEQYDLDIKDFDSSSDTNYNRSSTHFLKIRSKIISLDTLCSSALVSASSGIGGRNNVAVVMLRSRLIAKVKMYVSSLNLRLTVAPN